MRSARAVGLVALAFIALSFAAWAAVVRPASMIDAWCAEHHYAVVEKHLSFNPAAGPFWRARNEPVYRVRVRSLDDGTERVGWFRFRLWWVDQAWEGD
jgi:hypothetical protein